MAEVIHIRCDYCDQPARPWRIQSPPEPVRVVDLCDDHSSDIRALLGKARVVRGKPRPRQELAPSPDYE